MTATLSRTVQPSSRPVTAAYRTQPITSTPLQPPQPTVASLLALTSTLPTPSTSRSSHLLAAAKADDVAAVSRLVGSTVLPVSHPLHVNVNEADEYGMTALHYAALNGSAEMCEELLTHAANANQRDRYGQTPLLLASSKCHYLALQQLLAHKASIALLPPTLVTPLHRIAACPHPHQLLCGDALLAARQKLDAQTVDGETALHVAVRSGSLAFISWLLTHHANPSLTNRDGHTPLTLAASNSLIEDELLSYGAVGSRPVTAEVKRRADTKAAERQRVADERRAREAANAAAEEERRRLGEVVAKYGQAEVKEGLEGKWAKDEQDAYTAQQQQQPLTATTADDEEEAEDEVGGEAVLEEEDDEEARRAYREKMYSVWAERQAASATAAAPEVKNAWE